MHSQRKKNFNFDSEYVQLRRAWRDNSLSFRKHCEVVWFRYFHHLELVADYLFTSFVTMNAEFHPSLWVRDWNTFVYVLPFVEDPQQNPFYVSCVNEAKRLIELMPDVAVLICCGEPDTQNSTFITLVFHPDVDEPRLAEGWKIAGLIDRSDNSAYFWMLLNDGGALYNPISRSYLTACTCAKNSCTSCARYRYFTPCESYGGAFGISIGRHVAMSNSKRFKPQHDSKRCKVF